MQSVLNYCKYSDEMYSSSSGFTWKVYDPVSNFSSQVYNQGSVGIRIGCEGYYHKWPYPSDLDGQLLITEQTCWISYADSIPPQFSSPPEHPARQCGSIVQVDNQVAGETIPVSGTDFSLVYMSDRAGGRLRDYTIVVPVTYGSPTIGGNFHVRVDIEGNLYEQDFDDTPNQSYTLVWDGRNASGDYTAGATTADVTVTEPSAGSNDLPLHMQLPVGSLRAVALGFGGWMPSTYHFYDVKTKTLYQGDGTTRSVEAKAFSEVPAPPPSGCGVVVTPRCSECKWLVADEDGGLVHLFDATGRHMVTRFGTTGTDLYRFNYLDSVVTSIKLPFGRTITFQRSPDGVLQSIVGANGDITQVELVNGYLSSLTNANGESWSMSYTPSGLLTEFEKPEGQLSSFSYDTDGLLINDTHSGGASITLSHSVGDVTSTSAMNRSVPYRIGASLKFFDDITHGTPCGTGSMATAYVRDKVYADQSYDRFDASYIFDNHGCADSKIISTTMATGASSSSHGAKDARWGNMAPFITNSNINDSYISRTQSINLSDSADPFSIIDWTVTETNDKSKTTSTVYTGNTRTYVTTSPLGRQSTLAIDAYERPTRLNRGNDAAIAISWDKEHLSKITQAGRVVSFFYDPTTRRLSTIKNALNQQMQFSYDPVGRLTQLTRPDGALISFSYDANGNVVSVTPPGRSDHLFDYDPLEMPGSYTAPLLPNVPNPVTMYEWNLDRQLTSIQRPSGTTIAYEYDAASGVPTSITTDEGNYAVYETAAGQLQTITSPDGLFIQFGYDRGRPAGEYVSNSSTNLGSFSRQFDSGMVVSDSVTSGDNVTTIPVAYTYDDDDLLVGAGALTLSRDAASGRTIGSNLGNVTDSYGYNTLGELLTYEAKYAGVSIYKINLVRDALGRVASRSETISGITTTYVYSYDAAGRLTTVTKDGAAWQAYAYDANGNRTGGQIENVPITGTYDAQDRMVAYNMYTYGYNANGELSSKTSTLTGDITQFTHDSFGQLKQVIQADGSLVGYQTDGLHRRSARILGYLISARYLYMDNLRIAAETSAAGTIRKRFVYATRSNVPDYWQTPSGVLYRIISDDLGSPRLVVRVSDGVVMQTLRHDPFGRVIEDTKPGYQPFGFAGGLYDKDTKLVRFGAREYDPETGRWLSKDPILFAGGDPNLYGYVLNDPVNLFDPAGLAYSVDQAINAGATGAIAGAYTGATGGFVAFGVTAIPGAAIGAFLGGVVGFAGNSAAQVLDGFLGVNVFQTVLSGASAYKLTTNPNPISAFNFLYKSYHTPAPANTVSCPPDPGQPTINRP